MIKGHIGLANKASVLDHQREFHDGHSLATDLRVKMSDVKVSYSLAISIPSEEFELTANSLGAHMKVTESSPGMGHGELILRTFI